ncbi:hypothetical protein LSAT2_024978 [Lamellibrachia satsuma]|nr:hypothetical protein LSAT2_024978 [Lamellibrachia satsuma]
MDQHYNCCWPTSQGRVKEADRSQDFPWEGRPLLRGASRVLPCLVRVSDESRRERGDGDLPISRGHKQRNVNADTRAFFGGRTSQKRPSSTSTEALSLLSSGIRSFYCDRR